jgi:nitrogen fixation NifU-like protein
MGKDFDFWKDHSDTFLTMAYLWERRTAVNDPDGYGKKTGDCGDTIEMFLSIRDETLQSLNFMLEGCMNTNACSNALAMLAEGKDLSRCWEIGPRDIIDYLETLPADHYHCAELAVGTFYLALADYSCKTGRSAGQE